MPKLENAGSNRMVVRNSGFGFHSSFVIRLFAATMNIGTFILKNALRNKRRALLSVSSVAVSLFLLVTLQVALRELTIPPQSAGADLRVAVRNKISLTN